MAKVEQARQILDDFGLPAEQRNEIAGYTLLVLTGAKKRSQWKNATKRSLRIHDILTAISEDYGKQYAENTRETIRRRVLHQFEQAGIVKKNPDAPDLPTNSPRTHYALTDAALNVVRAYGTRTYKKRLQRFRKTHGMLLEIYLRTRERHTIPVQLPSGKRFRVSPGQHNLLQRAIINDFAPRSRLELRSFTSATWRRRTCTWLLNGCKPSGFPSQSTARLQISSSTPRKGIFSTSLRP